MAFSRKKYEIGSLVQHLNYFEIKIKIFNHSNLDEKNHQIKSVIFATRSFLSYLSKNHRTLPPLIVQSALHLLRDFETLSEELGLFLNIHKKINQHKHLNGKSQNNTF